MKHTLKTTLLLCTIVLLASCKKNYTCTCTDGTGTKTVVFTEKNTKGKASSKCDAYYNNNYGSVPFNTTSCALD